MTAGHDGWVELRARRDYSDGIHVCMDMCIGMSIDKCIDNCIDMCTQMRIDGQDEITATV